LPEHRQCKKRKQGIILARKAGNLFATAYLILIFGIYPFYMKQGYVDIGKAKYLFFLCCSLAAAGILGLAGIVCGVQTLLSQKGSKKALFLGLKNLSLTDMFVILFATELFLSFVYSDYRKEALWGTEGWYMGFVLFLILCVLYFLISRLWTASPLIWHVGMAVSGIIFLLGILDRFSLYLIPLEIRQPGFISTLGNINWFCGYLSVLAPLGICPLVLSNSNQWPAPPANCPDAKKERRRSDLGRNLVYISYTIVAFAAGFCQGSNSIFLFWGALFFSLLWIAASQRLWLTNCLLPVSLWCFSAQLVRILLFLFPEGYNYEANNPCLYLAGSNVILLTGVISLALYLFLRKKIAALRREHQNLSLPSEINRKKAAHRILAGFLAVGLFLWLCLSLINTRKGIPFLSESSLFLLNTSWGNGRGAALKTGLDLFCQMPFYKKILGVGPDCFSSWAYSLPDVAAELHAAFGSSRLTNAHNELLTCLVNTGIAGTFFYLGIFLSFMGRCLKKGQDHQELYLGAICAFCYLVHNLVSFSQVLNLPFIFLIMGMGEAILRQDTDHVTVQPCHS